MLELREVERFNRDGHGWGHGWADWYENKRRDRRAVEFSFIEDDEEVARARIDSWCVLRRPASRTIC